jgi:hypothetical protein
VAGSAERDGALTVRVEDGDVVRLTWLPGVRIDAELAAEAMAVVDALNGDRERPLLVDMTGIATVTREARMVFTRECTASRLALLGRSAVDRVIANFVVGLNTPAMPVRFFTSEPAATAWLTRVDSRG